MTDPETRISFLFARSRPTQPRSEAARGAGTVVWPTAAPAAIANLIIKKYY